MSPGSAPAAPTARLPLGEALERLEAAAAGGGGRSIRLFEHGTLEVKLYAPRGHDPQTPHERDEIYVVARGQGTFWDGERRHPFEPGTFLFAAAGRPHRFEAFSDDLAVWVMFYGPRGGEAAG
jgi:mannose-6-phosphate isomerase-like protein (cupin superfamily)